MAAYRNFAEFWPFYVLEHSKPGTRQLHFIGTTLLFVNLVAIPLTGSIWFLPAGIVAAYSCAWIGHFGIEKNRPATFQYPFFSLIGDFKMYGMMLAGKMDQEVENLKSISHYPSEPSGSGIR
ncbi:MAG TPA: DUF962 domain-containing protein [Acidobacteriota bacterium]